MRLSVTYSDLTLRVAARYSTRVAKEFPSPEAMKEYLKDHPAADPKNHWVKDQEKPKGDDKEKPSDKKPKEEEPSEKKPKAEIPQSKPLIHSSERARVGIGGKEVLPPPALPRLNNLRDDEKALEDRMNSILEKNPEGATEAFLEVAKDNKWVFETDAGKELLPEWSRPDLPPDERGKPVHPERAEFRGKYNAVLHQAANAIAKRAFLSRLDEIAKMPEDKRKVLVTSGGVAAGKGSALAGRPDLVESVSATWDAAGEQNATENEWVLEECAKRGIRPTFFFVATDPVSRWPGVIDRAKGIGRMVDAQLFADSYAIGAKNFQEFHEKHKDDADFVFANSTKLDKSKLKPGQDPIQVDISDEMPEAALKLDAADIYNQVSEYTEGVKDDLPDYIYEGATFGRRAWAE